MLESGVGVAKALGEKKEKEKEKEIYAFADDKTQVSSIRLQEILQ